MVERLPWQGEMLAELFARQRAGRLPHALLLSGPAGLGKLAFAQAVSAGLMCEQPGEAGEPCGRCKGCQLLAAGTHPDFLQVELGEGARDIKIAQVRELIGHLTLTSQYVGHRVAIINPAERMNVNAANSLLKTLEEPSAGTQLILISSQPSRLLATIRSRCQVIPFRAPATDTAEAWLRAQGVAEPALPLILSGGAPLAALALSESGALERRRALFDDLQGVMRGKGDPLAVAARWAKEEGTELLDWLASWSGDMIRLRMAGGTAHPANPDLAEELRPLAETVDLNCLYGRLDRVLDARRLGTASINRQLLLEELFIDWSPLAVATNRSLGIG